MNSQTVSNNITDIISGYINFSDTYLPICLHEKNVKNLGLEVIAFLKFCDNPDILISWLEHPDHKSLWKKDILCWKVLCMNPNIPCSFFQENFELIKELSEDYQCGITTHFLEDQCETLCGVANHITLLELLASNYRAVPWSFIEKNIKDFNYYECMQHICANPYLPPEAFECLFDIVLKHKDRTLWELLLSNINVPINVLEKFSIKYCKKPIGRDSIALICRSNPNSDTRNYFLEKYSKNLDSKNVDFNHLVDGQYIVQNEIEKYFNECKNIHNECKKIDDEYIMV